MMTDTFAEPPKSSNMSSYICPVLVLKQDCMNRQMFSYCVVCPESADPFQPTSWIKVRFKLNKKPFMLRIM
eukprot:7777914-Prorocentrum_lima.AAC.1